MIQGTPVITDVMTEGSPDLKGKTQVIPFKVTINFYQIFFQPHVNGTIPGTPPSNLYLSRYVLRPTEACKTNFSTMLNKEVHFSQIPPAETKLTFETATVYMTMARMFQHVCKCTRMS